MRGQVWLPGTPDVQQLGNNCSETFKEEIIKHADSLVSTINPAVHIDGSNLPDAPAPTLLGNLVLPARLGGRESYDNLVNTLSGQYSAPVSTVITGGCSCVCR